MKTPYIAYPPPPTFFKFCMKISDTLFFKTTPLFYQPLSFFWRKSNPLLPPLFGEIWNAHQPLYKEGVPMMFWNPVSDINDIKQWHFFQFKSFVCKIILDEGNTKFVRSVCKVKCTPSTQDVTRTYIRRSICVMCPGGKIEEQFCSLH